jgi:hypothetical protein
MRHLLLVLFLLFGATTFAHGDDAATREAKERFKRGKVLVEKKQLAEAYDEFARGFAASNRPGFLFNMAEAARGMGKLDVARDDYERYLAADPTGPYATLSTQRLAELPKREPLPPPRPIAAPVSPPAIVIPPPAESAQRIEATPASADRPMVDDKSEPSKPLWKRWPVWVGVGVVLVGGVLATVMLTSGDSMTCGSNPNCVDLRN